MGNTKMQRPHASRVSSGGVGRTSDGGPLALAPSLNSGRDVVQRPEGIGRSPSRTRRRGGLSQLEAARAADGCQAAPLAAEQRFRKECQEPAPEMPPIAF